MTENQRLKFVRKSLKETQVNFGASLGLTQAGYSDIERGKNSVSGKIKILLQRVHNLNLNWLKTGEGEMFTATIEENDFDSEQLASYQKHFEKLQLKIESLEAQLGR